MNSSMKWKTKFLDNISKSDGRVIFFPKYPKTISHLQKNIQKLKMILVDSTLFFRFS